MLNLVKNLERGQNEVLNMNIFHVGLGWKVSGAFDLDVAAFMVDSNKKIINDDYLVFYNSDKRVLPENKDVIVTSTSIGNYFRTKSHPVDPEISVIGSIDDEGDEEDEEGNDRETMDINLSKVHPNVQEIIITVSIYGYERGHQNFGQVTDAYVRIFKPGNEAPGQEEYRYDLTEDFSTATAVEFCRLYRHNGTWKIKATGIAHKGGLQELVDLYR